MLTTFSQYLLQHDLVSHAELEEASQATVLFGGRLGTALIELGVLSPDQLDAALARHHGLPEIPREWLARPDAGARAALHVDLIKRHRTFPLNFEKRSLHVGLVDPRNEEVLDNLAFASGCLVVPYALAEFRFVQLMQRVFAMAPSTRFKNLLDEGNRARVMRGREEQRKRIAEERLLAADALEIGPLAADLDLSESNVFFVGDASAPRSLAPASAAAERPAETSLASGPPPLARPVLEIDDLPLQLDRRVAQPDLEALERTIAKSEDRAKVIEASLALARRFAEVAALFVIRSGVAAGLSAQRGEEALDIDAALFPLASESALAACYASQQPFRTLPSSGLDNLLARALRSNEQTELAVFPISIGGRVVNLLVAQAQSGALGATANAALEALAPQIGSAYERLIRDQKQKAQTQPAAAPSAAKPTLKASIGALPLVKRVVRVPSKN